MYRHEINKYMKKFVVLAIIKKSIYIPHFSYLFI